MGRKEFSSGPIFIGTTFCSPFHPRPLYPFFTLSFLLLSAWCVVSMCAGSTGPFCEHDVNGCAFNDCGFQRSCTDVAAPNSGHSCSACHTGYRAGSTGVCEDKNECTDGTPCSMLRNTKCVNSIGSHTCVCESGYTGANNSHCTSKAFCVCVRVHSQALVCVCACVRACVHAGVCSVRSFLVIVPNFRIS